MSDCLPTPDYLLSLPEGGPRLPLAALTTVSQPDSYSEVLPTEGPPSFRGQSVKYVYKLAIGCQRVNSPITLLRVPLRVLVLTGKLGTWRDGVGRGLLRICERAYRDSGFRDTAGDERWRVS